jgi:cytochrome P450
MEADALDLSGLQPGYSTDPYPIYANLRASAPARRVLLNGLPAWLITRYEDAERVLGDPRVSNDPRHASQAVKVAAPWVFASAGAGLGRMMLLTDPPDHTRLRRMVSKVFTARRVEALRPRVEEITAQLLGSFATRGEVELIGEFATPLPVTVISELLGVPGDERDDFLTWSTTVLAGSPEPDAAMAAFTSIHRYLADLVARKQHDSIHQADGLAQTADLLTALAAAGSDDDPGLDHEELLSMAFLLLIGGFATTTNLIGNGVLSLLRNPDQLAALRREPALTGRAVEELLRYESPVEMTSPRFATADIEIGGSIIRSGEAILVALGSANRDPARFGGPDSVDISRDSTRHIAFGHGMHYCLGAPLARLEGQIGLQAILGLDQLALAVEPDELEWVHDPHVRGLRNLPLTFTPVADQ